MTRAEVDCWVVAPGDEPDLGCLTSAERRLADRIGSATARHRHAVARATLRYVLAGRLGVPPHQVPLAPERGVAPRLAYGTGLRVALAHSGPHVAVALGRSPLGVDLEVVGWHRRVPGPAASPAKRRAVEALVDEGAVEDAVWVVQEAALKADGVGLGFPFDRIRVVPHAEGLRVDLVGRGAWGVTLVSPEPGLVVAVASEGPPPRVILHRMLPPTTTFDPGGAAGHDGRSTRRLEAR